MFGSCGPASGWSAADLPLALRILAIVLVPAPRHVLAMAPLAYRSGAVAVLLGRRLRFALTWGVPTGTATPKGKARGECLRILLERYQTPLKTLGRQSNISREQDREGDGLEKSV